MTDVAFYWHKPRTRAQRLAGVPDRVEARALRTFPNLDAANVALEQGARAAVELAYPVRCDDGVYRKLSTSDFAKVIAR